MTKAEAIEFVSGIRARSEEVRDALDPNTAERVLLAAVGDEDINDIDARDFRTAEMFLLAGIVSDLDFDDGALDEFMIKARASADSLLA
jgi:hypothetical protein